MKRIDDYLSRARELGITIVGNIEGRSLGVEIYRTPSGGYEVGCYIYDEDENPAYRDWMAVGNAEETKDFKTYNEAFHHGMCVLLEEVGSYYAPCPMN